MTDLRLLIEQVEADTHSHVVVMPADEGIRWHGESESACQVMADILGDARVLTREKFIVVLHEMQKELEDGATHE